MGHLQRGARMLYTVTSQGRPIGVTDLGFIPLAGVSRSGYFFPNAEGERVISTIAAALPAMRAYLLRDVTDEHGHTLVHPAMLGSPIFADLAEWMHHAAAHQLALQREDGSLVRTTLIGLQDTSPFSGRFGVELVASRADDGIDDMLSS